MGIVSGGIGCAFFANHNNAPEGVKSPKHSQPQGSKNEIENHQKVDFKNKAGEKVWLALKKQKGIGVKKFQGDFVFFSNQLKKLFLFTEKLDNLAGLEYFSKRFWEDLDANDGNFECMLSLWCKLEDEKLRRAIQDWIKEHSQQVQTYLESVQVCNKSLIKKYLKRAKFFIEKQQWDFSLICLNKLLEKSALLGALKDTLDGLGDRLELVKKCFITFETISKKVSKELSSEDQIGKKIIACSKVIMDIAKNWLIENESHIKTWIETGEIPRTIDWYSYTDNLNYHSRLEGVLQFLLIPRYLMQQLERETQDHSLFKLQEKASFFLIGSNQNEKVKKVIFDSFFNIFSIRRSFFKDYAQLISISEIQSDIKDNLKDWLVVALKDYLKMEKKYQDTKLYKLTDCLEMIHDFVRYFSEDEFLSVVKKWLINDALIKLKNDYLNLQTDYNYSTQFKAIQLYNQLFHYFFKKECQDEEIIQWVQNFFEKKDQRIRIYAFDPIERLKLAVHCIQSGEPLSSQAKEWLLKNKLILKQKIEEDDFRMMNSEELILLYFYTLK